MTDFNFQLKKLIEEKVLQIFYLSHIVVGCWQYLYGYLHSHTSYCISIWNMFYPVYPFFGNFHVHDQVCLLKFVAVTIGVVKSSDKLKPSSASLVVRSFSLLYIYHLELFCMDTWKSCWYFWVHVFFYLRFLKIILIILGITKGGGIWRDNQGPQRETEGCKYQ